VTRAFAALAFAALAATPLAADAQAPNPKPTNAIKHTQSAINTAKQKQMHAQMATKKTASQRVGSGGAHPDSEVPNNPGENSSKPGAGPGYANGPPPSASSPSH
jgi:opacity protein-like surface antigen